MLLKNTDHMRIYILVGLTLFLWTNYTVQGQSAFSRCHVLFPRDSCYAVFKPLRENLLRNSRNIYELNRAFYPMGRFTSTVLINILYSVDFMQTAFSFNNTPVCSGVDQNSSLLEGDIDNDRVLFLSGWSSSEIFNVISPLQLSQIQLQISNEIFSLFVIPGSGIALPQRFGWVIQDAQHSLVNLDFTNLVYINITVTDNISCVPNEQLIHSALQEITIMLKVWASTEGEFVSVNEDNLGFVSEPGFTLGHDIPTLHFTPYFAVMVTCTSFILGLLSIGALGSVFPNIFHYLSKGERQFKFYFFSLSVSLSFLNVIIILNDVIMVPKWCDTPHFSYLTRQIETSGCSGLISAKMCYFILAIIFSFLAAALTSKNYKLIGLKNEEHERKIYIICCWSIILFTSLVVWAIPPTLLIMLAYPSIIITLTFMMIASFFWFSVILTIPQLLLSNFRMNLRCTDTLKYLTPFGGLVVLMFTIGLVTVIYLNSIVYGSDIGGPIGILAATVPSLFLTFFVELYLKKFLKLKTTLTEQQSDLMDSDAVEGANDVQLSSLAISQNNESGKGTAATLDNGNEQCNKISQHRHVGLDSKEGEINADKKPGSLQKRLQKLNYFSKQEL